MDEKGFRIGCGRAHLVITLDPNKPLRMTDPKNRDYITSVESFHLFSFFQEWIYCISGVSAQRFGWRYIDWHKRDGLFELWFGYRLASSFHLSHKNRRAGAWILLVNDGFGSHSTLPFFRNVGVLQPFKHYHTEAIDKAVQLGDSQFGKLEFLAAFQSFRNQTFKSSTIRHASRITGIVRNSYHIH